MEEDYMFPQLLLSSSFFFFATLLAGTGIPSALGRGAAARGRQRLESRDRETEREREGGREGAEERRNAAQYA